jgi:hypothetical protein
MELPVAYLAKSGVFAALLVEIVTQLEQGALNHPHQLQLHHLPVLVNPQHLQCLLQQQSLLQPHSP